MSTRTASERNPQAWMTPIGPKPFRQHPRAQRFTPLINRVAREEGVNPALIHAVVSVESNYNPRARSHAGAEGLMQLMPKTAERFGLAASERLDPEKNLRAGIRYLKFLQRYFEGDLILMLAAYNAGEGAVEQYGRVIPPYPETQAYVKKVQRQLARFSATGAS
ncbi:MAG: lytic transglycosylase domain-containing protein [Candidatus Competibacteraceae bacterium]|nr:lytic transglycosylase domain-containing protein [Candidatus Competibacteraceae bacterium]